LASGPSAAICWPEAVQAELNHIIHQQTKRKSQLKGKCLTGIAYNKNFLKKRTLKNINI